MERIEKLNTRAFVELWMEKGRFRIYRKEMKKKKKIDMKKLKNYLYPIIVYKYFDTSAITQYLTNSINGSKI